MPAVLQAWASSIPWKMQSILQGGFRGPDDGTFPAIKSVGRWLRTVSQYNADPSKQYMEQAPLPSDIELCDELEYRTCHFTHHLADALRVVAIYADRLADRDQAWKYHYRIAEELFHFVPEDDVTFMKRHADKVDQFAVIRQEIRDHLV